MNALRTLTTARHKRNVLKRCPVSGVPAWKGTRAMEGLVKVSFANIFSPAFFNQTLEQQLNNFACCILCEFSLNVGRLS